MERSEFLKFSTIISVQIIVKKIQQLRAEDN